MIPESVTIIGKAVSADAKARQPSGIERALAASMLDSVESEAGKLLTPERIGEMIENLGLREKPSNPFSPSHPMHFAWEMANKRRKGWSMEYPTC
ncbi:hypothetical protein [Vreelandella aquamarina]|uniref:hypothetical protein n=1 Tax=Vreelandella aquamarina TaxID=77097 RepID=UPI0007809E28|nr:hypothetical protein [Halomonas axialensis]